MEGNNFTGAENLPEILLKPCILTQNDCVFGVKMHSRPDLECRVLVLRGRRKFKRVFTNTLDPSGVFCDAHLNLKYVHTKAHQFEKVEEDSRTS